MFNEPAVWQKIFLSSVNVNDYVGHIYREYADLHVNNRTGKHSETREPRQQNLSN